MRRRRRRAAAAAQKILKHVDPQDRFNTFTMGIGWVAIVKPEDVERAKELLADLVKPEHVAPQ